MMKALTDPLGMLILALILPWVCLSAVTITRLAPWVRLGLPVPPIIALLLAFYPPSVNLEWHGLLLGSQFGVDAVNRIFLGVTATAWLAASLLAVPFAKTTTRSTRFVTCFLLAMAGNFALVLSQDAVSFYTAFALMSLAAYGLVNHDGDAASAYAGRVYIGLAIVAELLLFAALLGIAHGATDVRFPLVFDTRPPDWVIACAVLGFGVKAGLVPLHMSLPLSYAAAPLPAGVALAGAMLNAGLLGWLRWLPLGSFEFAAWGMLFIISGLVGVFYGVTLGLLQSVPRALLGYSSISQVGLMMLFLGVGLMAPDHWSTTLQLLGFFVLHHALAKTALFCASSGHIPKHGPRWIWWIVLGLPALALIGVPWTSGFFAKAGLKEVITSVGETLHYLSVWLTAASVGTALLMFRWFYLAVRTRSDGAPIAGAPWVVVTVILAIAVAPTLTPASTDSSLTIGEIFAGTWPTLLAALVGGAVWYCSPPRLAACVGFVPNGDVAWIIAGWLSRFAGLVRRMGATLGRFWEVVSTTVITWVNQAWQRACGGF